MMGKKFISTSSFYSSFSLKEFLHRSRQDDAPSMIEVLKEKSSAMCFITSWLAFSDRNSQDILSFTDFYFRCNTRSSFCSACRRSSFLTPTAFVKLIAASCFEKRNFVILYKLGDSTFHWHCLGFEFLVTNVGPEDYEWEHLHIHEAALEWNFVSWDISNYKTFHISRNSKLLSLVYLCIIRNIATAAQFKSSL